MKNQTVGTRPPPTFTTTARSGTRARMDAGEHPERPINSRPALPAADITRDVPAAQDPFARPVALPAPRRELVRQDGRSLPRLLRHRPPWPHPVPPVRAQPG